MKTTIGIYDSHKTAIDAIEVLKNKDFPVNQLSVIGHARIVDDHVRVKSNETLKNVGVSVGIVIGSTLGILSGAGVFAVPGLGFVFGAGAIVGALAGFDIGLVGGGLVSLLATYGIKKDKVVKYTEHLEEGKFLVIAQGNEEEAKIAKRILDGCGTHLELCSH